MGISRHKTQKTYSGYAGHKDAEKNEAIGDKRRAAQSGGSAALAVVQEPLRLPAAPSMPASTAVVAQGKENLPPTSIALCDAHISRSLVAAPTRRALETLDRGAALSNSLPEEPAEDVTVMNSLIANAFKTIMERRRNENA
jgi:hypothetical protein